MGKRSKIFIVICVVVFLVCVMIPMCGRSEKATIIKTEFVSDYVINVYINIENNDNEKHIYYLMVEACEDKKGKFILGYANGYWELEANSSEQIIVQITSSLNLRGCYVRIDSFREAV